MRTRLIASIAVASSILLTTSGCGFINPSRTEDGFDPAEGVSTTVGKIDLRSLLVLSEDGKTGSLVLAAINKSGSDQELTVQYVNGDGNRTETSVEIAEGFNTFGGKDAEQIFLENPTDPGQLLQVYFQYGSVPGAEVSVPVLNPTEWSYYKDLAPIIPVKEPAATEASAADSDATN